MLTKRQAVYEAVAHALLAAHPDVNNRAAIVQWRCCVYRMKSYLSSPDFNPDDLIMWGHLMKLYNGSLK